MTKSILLALIALAGLSCAPARALETVETGLIGSANSGAWPFLIGEDEGMFEKAGIKLDLIYGPTAPGLMQQLAAGSLDVLSIGLTEPIHAAAKGAPVAILRILADVTPYEILAQKNIHKIEDLRGKTVCIGGLMDINAVYLERIMSAHGLKKGDYDIVVVGNTAQRFAALKSGTVAMTMLVPPTNFLAEKEGFTNLGLIMDYTKDIPQGSVDVYVPWAKKHPETAKAFVKALDEAVAWFYEPKNREGAINILAKYSHDSPEDIAESYDFSVRIGQFARGDTVSKQRIESLITSMHAIGDLQGTTVTADQLVLAGVTPVVP
ncbi:MAG TPA: ABC transporter substrate-binding protein [Stellaceae bacterium]|nr:ABC transporter substrate-binding protein [Stellaceae bacterium]